MILFIDSLPLHCVSERHWSIRVPIIPTPLGEPARPGTPEQQWVIDTGCTGEAFVWRHHLESAGINVDTDKEGHITIQVATGEVRRVAVCKTTLWLVSNISGQTQNCRLPLLRGVAFDDLDGASRDPERHRALIGMRLLVRLNLRMDVNFADRTFSLWVPRTLLRHG